MIHIPVCLVNLLHPPGTRTENLNITDTVNALQDFRFQYTELFAVPHADSSSCFQGNQRQYNTDHYINRDQYPGVQRIDAIGQNDCRHWEKNNRKHRADCVCEEKLQGFDVGYRDIHDVSGFPSNQIRGRYTVDRFIQMHPHFRENAVCAKM